MKVEIELFCSHYVENLAIYSTNKNGDIVNLTLT